MSATKIETSEGFKFSTENQKVIPTILAKYPKGYEASAVLPLLDLAQRQQGWIDHAVIEAVAEITGLAPIRVLEVTTFYTMFRQRPVGKHHIEVCTNISCWLRGADDVIRAVRDELGLEMGQTTADGQFSLAQAECLGACVNAPAVQMGDHYFEDLDYEATRSLIKRLRAGEKVTPGSQTGRKGSANSAGPTALTGLEGGA